MKKAFWKFFLSSLIIMAAPDIRADIAKLNKEACDILRVTRRDEMYKTLGLEEMDSARKKILESMTADEKKRITNSSNVEPYDPFFHSEESRARDEKAKLDFNQEASSILKGLATINGKAYTRADVDNVIRQVRTAPLYRETVLFQKPSFSIARNYVDIRKSNLSFLNEFGNFIVVVNQGLFTESGSDNPRPYVSIIASDREDSSQGYRHSMSEIIEKTLPENCKEQSLFYDDSFNSLGKDVSVRANARSSIKLDSNQNSVKESGGDMKSSQR